MHRSRTQYKYNNDVHLASPNQNPMQQQSQKELVLPYHQPNKTPLSSRLASSFPPIHIRYSYFVRLLSMDSLLRQNAAHSARYGMEYILTTCPLAIVKRRPDNSPRNAQLETRDSFGPGNTLPRSTC